MSDKKEIATLSIKISVDSTDLDKLEAQLKRIAGLMVNAGLKEPTSVGFSADMFFVKNGQTFIDSAFITSGTVSPAIKYTISGLHSDDYKEDLKQAVKQAIRPVIRNHIKVERVNEKQTGNVLRGGVRVDEGESAIANLDNRQDQGQFWTKENLKAGTDYWFYVRTVNSYGKSQFVEASGKPEDKADEILEFLGDKFLSTEAGKIMQDQIGDLALEQLEIKHDIVDINDKANPAKSA
ncbi:putative phage tail protein [Providencia alcalifaciens]|nr:putative phage tail protein [Providencia alcalifaciens]